MRPLSDALGLPPPGILTRQQGDVALATLQARYGLTVDAGGLALRPLMTGPTFPTLKSFRAALSPWSIDAGRKTVPLADVFFRSPQTARAVPETGRPAVVEWLATSVREGHIGGRRFGGEVRVDAVYKAYQGALEAAGHEVSPSVDEFGVLMARTFPSLGRRRYRTGPNATREPWYRLPPLRVARREFEERYGSFQPLDIHGQQL